VKQYSDEPVNEPLSLIVYPGVNGKTNLYEDDGKTFNHRRGEFMKVEMNWTDANRRLSLRLSLGSRMLAPNRRPLVIRVAGQPTTRAASFDGRQLDIPL
jgi:hypothetical protein